MNTYRLHTEHGDKIEFVAESMEQAESRAKEWGPTHCRVGPYTNPNQAPVWVTEIGENGESLGQHIVNVAVR